MGEMIHSIASGVTSRSSRNSKYFYQVAILPEHSIVVPVVSPFPNLMTGVLELAETVDHIGGM